MGNHIPSERLVAGLDLGGSNLRAVVLDDSGAVRASLARPLERPATPERAAAQVQRLLDACATAAGEATRQLPAVGLGLAAQLGAQPGQVAVAPNLGWSDVDFGALLLEELGRRVFLLNDVDAIALAESRCGAATGKKAVLGVFVGTGVGGGLVLGGKLYQGASGVAAEIGHVKVRNAGRACGCGQRGCLEAYLGGANLSAWLNEMVSAGWPALEDLAGRQGTMHPGLVEQLFSRGDNRARDLWQELAEMFGTVLANAVTLLNLDALVLGGTVLANCPGLRRLAIEVLRQRALTVSTRSLDILEDRLGPQAGAIGAAWYARGRMLDDDTGPG